MHSSGSDSVSPVHTNLELRKTVICGNRAFASVLTEAGILGKDGPTCNKWCPDKMAAVQNHTRQGDMKVRMGAEVEVYWAGCHPRRRKRNLFLRNADSTDTSIGLLSLHTQEGTYPVVVIGLFC